MKYASVSWTVVSTQKLHTHMSSTMTIRLKNNPHRVKNNRHPTCTQLSMFQTHFGKQWKRHIFNRKSFAFFNLLCNYVHKIIIHQRRSITPLIIVNISSSFTKKSIFVSLMTCFPYTSQILWWILPGPMKQNFRLNFTCVIYRRMSRHLWHKNKTLE